MRRILAGLVVVLVALPQLATADPVFLRTIAHAESFNILYPDEQPEVLPGCHVEGTTSATCDLVVPFTPMSSGYGTGYSSQYASAQAAFGHLHGEVWEFPDENGGTLLGYDLIATAEMRDMVTLSGGTGTGYLQYLFSGAIGSASSDYQGLEANSSFKFRHDGGELVEVMNYGYDFFWAGGPTSGELVRDGSGTDFSYTSALLPFTWDDPFEFYMYGRAMTEILFDAYGTGYMDVTFDGFRVFNANQQRVNNYRVSSAANAPYATAVPEPTSLLLMGTGLGAAMWKRRRHSSRAA